MSTWPREYLVVPWRGTLTFGWKEVVIKIPRGYKLLIVHASNVYKWKFVPYGLAQPQLVVQQFGNPGETHFSLMVQVADENGIIEEATPAEYVGFAAAGNYQVELQYAFQ